MRDGEQKHFRCGGRAVSVKILTFAGIIWAGLGLSTNVIYGLDEFDTMYQYCLQNADRVAAGENVINDLIASGMINNAHAGMTCAQVTDLMTASAGEKALDELVNACVRDPDCGDK